MISPLSEFDWSAAVGRRLEMACFAEYNVYLHFEGGLLVQIEGEFHHGVGSGNPSTLCQFPMSESRLPSVLEASIVDASHRDEMLRLVFSNGHHLSVSTGGPYETVHVHHNGTHYVGF
jgi:hypothetical protein